MWLGGINIILTHDRTWPSFPSRSGMEGTAQASGGCMKRRGRFPNTLPLPCFLGAGGKALSCLQLQ